MLFKFTVKLALGVGLTSNFWPNHVKCPSKPCVMCHTDSLSLQWTKGKLKANKGVKKHCILEKAGKLTTPAEATIVYAIIQKYLQQERKVRRSFMEKVKRIHWIWNPSWLPQFPQSLSDDDCHCVRWWSYFSPVIFPFCRSLPQATHSSTKMSF